MLSGAGCSERHPRGVTHTALGRPQIHRRLVLVTTAVIIMTPFMARSGGNARYNNLAEAPGATLGPHPAARHHPFSGTFGWLPLGTASCHGFATPSGIIRRRPHARPLALRPAQHSCGGPGPPHSPRAAPEPLGCVNPPHDGLMAIPPGRRRRPLARARRRNHPQTQFIVFNSLFACI